MSGALASHVAIVAAFTIPLSGCLLGVLLPTPADLPAALRFALANASAIVEDPDDPLADIDAGTVLDDLNTLDGCWASFRSYVSPPRPDLSLDVYQVFVFDAAYSRLVRYTYQNLFGAGTEVMIQSGSFSSADAGLIRFSVDRVEANMFGVIEDVTDRYDVPFVYDVHATLSGDRLKTWFELPGDPATPAGFADGTAFIHKRIACPE